MKKLVLVLVALLAFGAFSFAQGASIEPYVNAGDKLVNVGFAYGGFTAGFEYDLMQFAVGPFPITLGGVVRASTDFGIFFPNAKFWTAGAYALGHLSLKGIELPSSFGWASNCDTYLGLGLGALGAYGSASAALNLLVGEAYYLTPKLALYAEYNMFVGSYYRLYGVGASFKI